MWTKGLAKGNGETRAWRGGGRCYQSMRIRILALVITFCWCLSLANAFEVVESTTTTRIAQVMDVFDVGGAEAKRRADDEGGLLPNHSPDMDTRIRQQEGEGQLKGRKSIPTVLTSPTITERRRHDDVVDEDNNDEGRMRSLQGMSHVQLSI